MSIFHNNILGGAAAQGGSFSIERSLRFNSGDSAYLSRTPSSTGNRRTFTISGWVKRSKVGSQQPIFSSYAGAHPTTALLFNSDDKLWFYNYDGTYNFQLVTAARFRDPSAWMHFVVAVDSTQAAAGARVKIYINGEWIEDDFDTSSYPSQNFQLDWNNATEHNIGKHVNFLDGYLADLYCIDGQQLAASDFGEYDDNGVWQPIEYSGTYGTNGFHLDFSNNSSNSALGTDSSGNSNTWTVNNLSVASGAGNDSLLDVPLAGDQSDTGAGGEVSGNYATLNPLTLNHAGGTSGSLANGNLEYRNARNSYFGTCLSTISVSSGKWYFEGTCVGSSSWEIGIYKVDPIDSRFNTDDEALGYSATGYGYKHNGQKNNNLSASSYGASYTAGDVIGVALDLDGGTLTFYKNGTSQGTAFSSLSGRFAFGVSASSSSSGWNVNFGQRAFAYQNAGTNRPAATFKALCTTNLDTPAVANSSDHFDVKTYSGTGSTQSITGLAFSPDLVWIKNRSVSDTHAILDTHRGTNTVLSSNLTNGDRTEGGSLTAFNSDGFTVGSYNDTNRSSSGFVAWTWDAGSSASSNTNGTMTSSVRANTSAGFSMCTYTSPNSSSNQSFGHGLNAKPDFVIVKNRDSSYNYDIYHSSLGYNASLIFTGAATRSGAFSAEPTSTVVNTKHDYTHVNTDDYIAYCWTAVEGYSAFGSYTGNGNSDGPFVYTGFRPRWVLFKYSSTVGNWRLMDTERDPYNPCITQLYPDNSDAEIANSSAHNIDYLSNGFRVTTSHSAMNSNGNKMIWAAFAEHPFKYARAR